MRGGKRRFALPVGLSRAAVLDSGPVYTPAFGLAMDPIVVTASTPMELSLLVAGTSASPVDGIGNRQLFRGEIGGREVVLAVTGIGKVNAAITGTLLLERFRPSLLINTGCGGAFSGSGLAVGNLAVATAETFADEGVLTPDGWKGLELIGIPICHGNDGPLYNRIPLDSGLASSASQLAASLGFKTGLGPFLTVSTCSGTTSQGDELLRRFPGICENMEGAALAQLAVMYRTPLLEIRGISNLVEDRDLSRWNLRLAVEQVQTFLLAYLNK